MTIHSESRILQAPLDGVFDLVADVEHYPDFLPLWKEAHILRRAGDVYNTEQLLGIGQILERFETKTLLRRPTYIEVTSADPLFRTFYIRWDFAPVGTGCRIGIALEWELQSRLLQRVIEVLLPGVARTMIDSFEHRARELFG